MWTAAIVAGGDRARAQDGEVVARSVYIGQLEMRNRVLKLLIECPAIAAGEAVELNRLRRRAELWTDLLLASMQPRHEVGEFAFEASRTAKFVADLPRRAARGPQPDAAALVEVMIRTTARHAFAAASPNGDLNARVAAAVLEAYPPEQFDSLGLLRSAWMVRLATTADEAERLTAELFHTPPSEAAPPNVSRRFF